MTKPEAVPAVVSRIADEGSNARLLRLELPEGFRPSWRPGQFVEVAVPCSGLPERAYSIANPPQDGEAFEIVFDRHGPVSERLFKVEGGQTLLVRGPMGKWSYRDEDRRAALVSTGTGVAPLRAMVKYVLEKGLPNKLHLFYSEPTPGRLLFRRELEEARERGVEVHLSVTEPEGMWEEGQWWDGPRGPLGPETIKSALGDLSETAFYVCGGLRLIKSLRAGLSQAGVPEAAFRTEAWGDY